ncbi:MAG: NAD(P)-dependent oxidoreductase [Terrimesophilobacter sp.]
MTLLPRLLVTGAGGSIGRRLRARLDSDGFDVSYIVSTRADSPSGDSRADVVDITDIAGLNSVVEKRKPNVILHLAAVSGAACEADAARALAVNVDAVRDLSVIAQRHGVSRCVLASTAAVYGDQYNSPVSETGEIVTASLYAHTKRQAEMVLESATESFAGFSSVALRIFNVYGPGMVGSLANRLVDAREGSPVALAGLDTFVRDYVHVDDVVEAMVRAAVSALPTPWLVVNVGSGVPMSNRELVAALAPVYFSTADPRSSYSCADTDAARRAFGFIVSRKVNRSSVY